MFRSLVFRPWPEKQTALDHLNTGLALYSDPECIFTVYLILKGQSENKAECSNKIHDGKSSFFCWCLLFCWQSISFEEICQQWICGEILIKKDISVIYIKSWMKKKFCRIFCALNVFLSLSFFTSFSLSLSLSLSFSLSLSLCCYFFFLHQFLFSPSFFFIHVLFLSSPSSAPFFLGVFFVPASSWCLGHLRGTSFPRKVA